MALMPALVFVTPERSLTLLALPLLWLCHHVADGHFVPRTPLNIPILLLMGTVLINMFITPDITQSLSKISNLLFGIVLYFGLVRWATTARRRQWLLLGTAGIGVLLLIVALFATSWTRSQKIPVMAPTQDVMSQVPRRLDLPGAERGVNPNEVGGVLVMFVPFSAMLVLHEAGHPKRPWLRIVLFLLAFACTLIGTLVTQSRSAMLGLLFGLLSLSAWNRWWGRVIFIATLMLFGWLAWTGQLEPLLQAGGLVAPMTEFDTLNGRVQIWQRALYFIAQAPLTGIGLNHFRVALPAFWPLSSPLIPGDLGHAHNQFLQVAAELGLPGLIAYLSIWLGLAWRAITRLRPSASPIARRAAMGAASGLFAFSVYGIADTVALGARAGFPLWLFMALTVILTASPIPEKGNRPSPSQAIAGFTRLHDESGRVQ
jgi:putative inorganic carbon (hco3(-)) transporter